MAEEVAQFPNVPEEGPGIPWSPTNGEIFIKSSIYDPEEGPFNSDAPTSLDNEHLKAVEKIFMDARGRLTQELFERATVLMKSYLSSNR